eukprot:166848-Pyramimonas_sp.AAC.2
MGKATKDFPVVTYNYHLPGSSLLPGAWQDEPHKERCEALPSLPSFLSRHTAGVLLPETSSRLYPGVACSPSSTPQR